MIWMRPWRAAKAWPILVTQEVVTKIPFVACLLFHHDGERAHCLDADGAAVPLGLDDAEPAEDRVFVDGDGVDSAVFGCLCVPRLHAHCLEQLPDQVLELGGRHGEQVGPAVEARDGVHALDELVLRQEGLEVHDGPDSLEIAGVVG